jgi:hypothetical protein
MKKNKLAMPSIESQSRQAARSAPTHEEISRRAAELWRRRGCPESSDETIWLEAEMELQRMPEIDRGRGEIAASGPLSRLDLNTDEVMAELGELFPSASGKETTSL